MPAPQESPASQEKARLPATEEMTADAAGQARLTGLLRRRAETAAPAGTGDGAKGSRLPFAGRGITDNDLVIFTRQLATLVNSGVPLLQGLELQSKQAPNPAFRAQIHGIKRLVENGASLSEALKRYPKIFDTTFTSMVEAGEASGSLDVILNRLAAYIETTAKLKRQIKTAMVYPSAITLVAVVIVSLLVFKVVPVFERMFQGFGAELPVPTQLIIDLSHVLQANAIFIVTAAVGTVLGLGIFYRSANGRSFLDALLLRVPIFGDIVIKVSVARFCRTLVTLIASGVSILNALEICARTSHNVIIQGVIRQARQSIAAGRPLSAPLIASGVFPQMVGHMVSVGEATGALEGMLSKVADFYEEEAESAVKAMVALIEPTMMAFLGVTIGGLLIAMYLPVFTMSSAVGSG